jgi:hypothetical protein
VNELPMNTNPKVFVSHASEDKARFVLDFATKLRAKGIDAWLDKWEILPGDSLIDKIFEEGIKDAQAVIVVLSKNSVDKPWVREELNAAMVKKINGVSKLIPVVIDDCQVPEALQSTVWEKIKDLNNFETGLDHIVSAIFEHREKPPIDAPPAYAQTVVNVLPTLNKVDSLIFKMACEEAIASGDSQLIQVKDIIEHSKSLDIPPGEVVETLEILDKRNYIEADGVYGGELPFYHFSVTTYGFEEYARAYIENYDSIFESVCYQIVNHSREDNQSIIKALNQPQRIVDHVLDILHSKGFLIADGVGADTILIFDVSAELKRMLRKTQ